MVARNDITGDSIQTKTVSNAYRDNYDLIWKKEKKNESNSLEQESMPVLRPGEEPVETKGN